MCRMTLFTEPMLTAKRSQNETSRFAQLQNLNQETRRKDTQIFIVRAHSPAVVFIV